MNLRKVRDIEYQILPGTDRKTTDIVIERDGLVNVRPPRHFSAEQVDAVVESKRLWSIRTLQNGGTWMLHGWYASGLMVKVFCIRMLLSTIAGFRAGWAFKAKEWSFLFAPGYYWPRRRAAAKVVFERFFTAKGWSVCSLGSIILPLKWALSRCRNCQGLRLSLGFLLKRRQTGFPLEVHDGPAKVIDYIIVHELCHLHHRDHTDAFWNEVDKVLPDYREKKESLRNNGAKLICRRRIQLINVTVSNTRN